MENYKGIDYGHGMVNIDNNGIRFGVIHQHEVLQVWCDESEPYYGEIMCQGCLQVVTIDDETCPNCDHDLIDGFDFIEPVSYTYDKDGYSMESDDHGDIMVFKSPYYTHAQFCSPCAPGACYLTNPVEADPNNKCYCLGHDWFENEKAPYPVYDVKTDKLVNS